MRETQPTICQLARGKGFAARKRLTCIEASVIICIPEQRAFACVIDIRDGNLRRGSRIVHVGYCQAAADISSLCDGARVAKFMLGPLAFKDLGVSPNGWRIVHRLQINRDACRADIAAATPVIDRDRKDICITGRYVAATMHISQLAVPDILERKRAAYQKRLSVQLQCALGG